MKKRLIFLIAIMIIALTSCDKLNSTTTPTTDDPSTTITNPSDDNSNSTTKEDETANMKLILKINDIEVDVIWTDNDSVKALKELAKDGLTINMSECGGFEQTGLIGKTLPSADIRIDVVPGDIVLYNSNQISIFYNNSSWSYTKLGHINLSKSELKDLLDTDAVVVTFTLK